MLSIIIPAYNEEKRISPMLEAYGSFFMNKQKEIKNEILIVINNTTDNTVKIVEEYSKKYPNIKYLDIKPKGKGFATIVGFKESLSNNSDVIGFVDADLATQPEDFYDLYINLKNYDGIIGSRWKKGSKVERSIGKLIRSKGFNFLTRALFFFPYEDTQCGAKIFKKKVIEKVVDDINIPEWAFDVNILYLCKKNRFRIKEHPTKWVDKEGSTLNKPLKIPIEMAAGVFRLRLLHSPLKFIVRAYDRLLPEDYKIHKW